MRRSFMVPEPSFFLLVGQEEQLPGPKPIHLSPRKVNPWILRVIKAIEIMSFSVGKRVFTHTA